MKRTVVILLTTLMLFSLFQGALGENVVKADESYKWVPLNSSGLYNGTLLSFAIDPKNTQVIYAGTRNDGIFKSIDGGSSWTQISNGLTDLYVSSLVIDPTNTNVIYAGTWGGGVFKSTNSGTNWSAIKEGEGSSPVIVIDPKNTNTIYIETMYGGLFKSTDGGANWVQIGTKSGELIVSLKYKHLLCFAINPSDTNIIYVWTDDGLFLKSTNGGEDWTKADIGLMLVTLAAFDPMNSNVIYARVGGSDMFKTIDGGQNWTKISNVLPKEHVKINCFAINSKNTNIIYAGTPIGVFKSTNGGSSWTAVNNGLPNFKFVNITSIAIDPANPDIIYALPPEDGVYKTINGGKNWTGINKGLTQREILVSAFAIDPTNTNTIYAILPSRELSGSYVFKSADGGINWNRIDDMLPYAGIYSLVFDPANTQTIYAISGGLLKSTDGGSSWSAINNGLTSAVLSFAIDPKNTQVIYAGTERSGVFKSTNGGINWTQINNGLPKLRDIYSLAIDPQNTNIIYAGVFSVDTSENTIFKSTDGGTNWVQSVETRTTVVSLAIDPKSTNIIYAVTDHGNVIKSIDGGANWVELNSKMRDSGTGSSFIAIDPENTSTIYIGIYGGDIYKSTDNGSSWNVITYWPASGVNFIAIDPQNTKIIYVGTYGGSIFKGIQLQSYTIKSTTSLGGSISPSGTTNINSGDSKTFTITPNSGYNISNVKVDGVSKGKLSSYTFTNVISNHTIEVIFEKIIAPPSQTVIILQIGKSTFTVNGSIRTLDSPPVIKNSRTLLPIRAIIESLGGTVLWDVNEKKVTVTLGSRTIELWIGKPIAKMNGIDTSIDSTNSKVVPEIINGRTMLPLRFVTENLGCDVQWDGTTQTITITYPKP